MSDFIDLAATQHPDAFAARVHGDSMTPRYQPGDVVIFSPATQPESGEDCFVRFKDGSTTFKQVYVEGDILRLQPRNDDHRARYARADELAGVYRAECIVVNVRGMMVHRAAD